MAMNYTRILCRQSLNLRSLGCLYTKRAPSILATIPARTSTTAVETHDEKNQRLGRPLSPHLTIYKLQITSTLSVTHRATGIILGTYAVILGAGTLFIPGGIPCMIAAISKWGLPPAVLFVGKTLFAYPLVYHYLNGLRHLMWDTGRYLTIKEVYMTGWSVVGLAAIASAVVAML